MMHRDGRILSLRVLNLLNFTSKTSSLHIRHSWQFLVDIFLRFAGVILSGKSGKLLLFPFEFGVSLIEDHLFIIMHTFFACKRFYLESGICIVCLLCLYSCNVLFNQFLHSIDLICLLDFKIQASTIFVYFFHVCLIFGAKIQIA